MAYLGSMQWWLFKRPVHVSWRVALFCGGVMAGVFLAPTADFFASFGWFLFAFALGFVGLWCGRVYILPVVVLTGMMIGLWRGGIVQAELSPYKKLAGHSVVIKGSVREDPEIDRKGLMVLRLNVQEINGREMTGITWVTVRGTVEVKRSDTVEIKGKLSNGLGGYAASVYYAKITSVMRPVPGDVAGRMREWFSDQVRTVIPAPESLLGIGFLTGQNQSLPPELTDALKTAGLTHIVVASGYNLTILVRLARRVFARVSKYLAALTGSMMIGGFIAITGMSPSMSRAGLVAGLSLAAWYYGRRFHPLVLLPFVAAITLLINPTYGWNDVGWQLSFAAFAGVMILAPLLQAYFFGAKKPGIVRQVMGETMAAQIATLPILATTFGQVSNVALFANLLIVPLVPLAMLLTFTSGIGAAFLPVVASAIGGMAEIVLHYMIWAAQFFAGMPWAITEVSVPWFAAAGGCVLIVAACVYMQRVTKYDLRRANIVE